MGNTTLKIDAINLSDFVLEWQQPLVISQSSDGTVKFQTIPIYEITGNLSYMPPAPVSVPVENRVQELFNTLIFAQSSKAAIAYNFLSENREAATFILGVGVLGIAALGLVSAIPSGGASIAASMSAIGIMFSAAQILKAEGKI